MQRPKSNSRRQTLGSVSVNQEGNRRKSVDPNSRAPSNPKVRPPRGRVSMIPRVGRENLVPATPPSATAKQVSQSTGHRRSSVGGDRRQSSIPPSVPSRTDPRPVTDKAYQQECIKRLLNFLMEKGYEHPISHKSLARPSGKDFTNIVTFMLRRVDPNFQDGTLKMEDEVSMNFRAMGYPFPVSKTALVAAGSPHTWPTLLAALTWLMERIQCIENIAPEDGESGNFESLEELETKTDKAFFKYLSAAYTAFLRGDEPMTEQLENALADRFERDDGIIEQEIEQMTDKNAVIVERINNLTLGEEE
jgi:kinetochore protein NDC80